MWQFACTRGQSIVDEDAIYSNDIHALLCAYGVEAARAAILREIGGVFAVYKIDVDIRHLELIADYMVRVRLRLHASPVCLLCASVSCFSGAFILDVRWRLQTVQPKRHLDESITTP